MHFEFATAHRILFGPGALQQAAPAAQSMGSRSLLVTGRNTRRGQPLADALRKAGIPTDIFPFDGEPTVQRVQEGVEHARALGCDLVLSLGGGSAIDGGKAIAALVSNPGTPLDYLEVIGRGQPLTIAPLPFIAIPTTAGTGSEVTRNAVLGSPEHGVKASLRSAAMLPRLAIVDPELTMDLPPDITASTGLDALTQLIEPYTSVRANPLTDLLCLDGIRRAATALRQAYREPHDGNARSAMAMASTLGGMALANAGLGAVHGFAAPIGGMFSAPHGAVCAALLPHVTAANIAALRTRDPESERLTRYQAVAAILTANPHATPEDAVPWLSQLTADLRIEPLRAYGIEPRHFPGLVQKAAAASSMKGNSISLTAEELTGILRREAAG